MYEYYDPSTRRVPRDLELALLAEIHKFAPVPGPATLALPCMGAVGLLVCCRRRGK